MKKDVNILENIVLNQEFMNWQLLMTKGGGGRVHRSRWISYFIQIQFDKFKGK